MEYMVDWRQIHISPEVGFSRKLVEGGGKKSMELNVKIMLKKEGIWGIKFNCPTEPSN